METANLNKYCISRIQVQTSAYLSYSVQSPNPNLSRGYTTLV